MPIVVLSAIESTDVGELLTLQRAAYVTEAQIYGDSTIPPLVQTLDELAEELSSSLAVKATLDHRIVGAVRGRCEGPVLRISRLMVAPDMQGQGIGTRLLAALESLAPASTTHAMLFTGHRSAANIRLYERLGYRETDREELAPSVTLVHLKKPINPADGRRTSSHRAQCYPGTGAD